jgi:MarR family transcriptional regulator for hemolysin
MTSSRTSRRESARMTLGASLAVLARAYRAAADQAVAHVGLSQALAWPLVMIGRQGDGMRQGMLAELLVIEGPSLARSLDQLVQAGFVERREDPTDRRAKTLHLTPSGARASAQIEAALIELRSVLYEGIADTDLAACVRVFATLSERLGCPVAQFPLVRAEPDGAGPA